LPASQVGAVAVAKPRGVGAVDHHLSFRGAKQQAHQVQEGRLAASRPSDDGHEFAGFDLE